MKTKTDSAIDTHRLVGEPERKKITNVSRSGWLVLEKRGRTTGQKLVPDRVAVTPGKSAWRLADLVAWVRSRPTYKPATAPRCARKGGGSQSDGGGREGCSSEAQAAEREKMAARLAETPESALKAPGGDHGQT